MKRIQLVYGLLACILIFSCFLSLSCTHDSTIINDLDTVCFDTQILPIMQTSCGISGCHDYAGESGFVATSYNSIVSAVTPGNARNSSLYKAITALYGETMMPPDRPLTQQQRMLIEVWIEQGALNTRCSSTTPTVPDTTIGLIDSLCFKQNVLPIFITSCAKSSCHDAINHHEGYNLSDYNSIINSGDGVVPFNPGETKIYKVLNESGEDRMPPAPLPPLTANQKETIRKWIADGALNSDCPNSGCDTTGIISFSNQIWPIINNNCVGCHNSSTHYANVDLSSYSQINYFATQSQNSIPVLIGVVRKLPGFLAMPPSGNIGECNIRKIEMWINQGKLNN